MISESRALLALAEEDISVAAWLVMPMAAGTEASFLAAPVASGAVVKEEDGKCKAALVLDALLIELLVVDDMVASFYQFSKCAMLKRFGSSVNHFRGGVKFPGLSANFSELF